MLLKVVTDLKKYSPASTSYFSDRMFREEKRSRFSTLFAKVNDLKQSK